MLYCAYTCDYVFFSGFSQASRNFLANFREGARKSLNRAENRGGLGTIRDDLGSYSKVLKTVCLTGTGVRIPQPAPKNTNFSVGVFLFFVLNLCAVTMGEERKTVDNCFSRTKSTKQGVIGADLSATHNDYAT